MADDLRQAAEQARQQSELFLQRSREQMQATFATQRQMGVGHPAGTVAAAGVAAGAAGSSMMAGTPAGKVLEAINAIIRRGIGIGGGAIGGPVSGAFGGMAAMGAGAAAAGGFMMGSAPFGPTGMGSGALEGAQRNMSTMQMLFTAYGGGFPGIGRWAGQRMDMTAPQAREIASEEVQYRLWGGLKKGAQKGWNIASLGVSNVMLRRYGMELDTTRSEDYNRSLQQNLRFMTGENLERAGFGQYRGAFATGITREGAIEIGKNLKQELSDIQRQTGASAEQLIAIQGRALGTMGALGLNRAMAGGRQNFEAEVGRNTRSVREIQQTLKLSEEEADQFFRSMGQLYGTATRIAEMARTSRRAAGRMGMDVRDVFGIIRQFEDTGRSQLTGQAATGAVGLRMAEQFRGWQKSGIMSQEESMMYGGRTYEEGLQIMTQRAYQMGTGLFESGRMGGMGLMMRYNQGAYNRFAGGGMGMLEAAGAVGGMVAGDPLMQLRARYDEKIRRQSGEEGLRAKFLEVKAMQRSKQFMFGGEKEELYQAFEQRTGTSPLDAKRWFNFFQRESDSITNQIKGMPDYENMTEGERSVHEQGILALHQRLRSEGQLGFVQDVMGGNVYEAVGRMYKEAKASGLDLKSESVTMLLRKTNARRRRAFFDARREDTADLIGVAGTMGAMSAMAAAGSLTGKNLSLIGKTLEASGMSKEDMYEKVLSGGVDAGEDHWGYTWSKAGFDPLRGFDTDDVSDEALVNVADIKTRVSTYAEDTDLAKRIIGVQAFGQKRKMSLDEVKKYFPNLYKKLTKAIAKGTKGYGTVEGVRGALDKEGSDTNIEKAFREKRQQSVMARFSSTIGYLFGQKGAKYDFDTFATRMLGGAVGEDKRRYDRVMSMMPEVKEFLDVAQLKGGSVNVEALMAHYGDDLYGMMEEATGISVSDIKEKIAASPDALKQLLSNDTVISMFAGVMAKQSKEAIPLGDAAKPMMTKIAETSLQRLSDILTYAIKNAIS